MRGVNKVILVATLGKDPEQRFFPNGDAVCNFSVATNESWKDKNSGETKTKTEWINIVCTRKLAEIAAQYLKKGSKVYIEGKLQTRKWQDKSGQDKYMTEVVAQELQMLDGRPSGGQAEGKASAAPARSQEAPPFEDDDPEKIPF